MSNSVLALRTISKSYSEGTGTLTVLREASLTIAPGELVALIGPSGSGKSTLLHIAGLLDAPDAGDVLLRDESMAQASDARRTALRNAQLGFIYQFHHLLPELTALENITMPLRIAGKSAAESEPRALALLERLGLKDRAAHLPSQLSGGEQQRVAIARALTHQPALLLADEPTGNLDPTTSDHVVALLLELAREQNTAALIATHNMELAAKLHRRITLKDGKVVEL